MPALKLSPGKPVVIGPTNPESDQTALDVRVYGGITDHQLQAYAAQRLGGQPEQYTVRRDAA